ncbi:MAG: transporter substrate-binding domain-containing protein [Betaproteobacteria bacterium]
MLNDFIVRLIPAVFATLFLSQMAMAEPLLMVYRDKPPYSFVDNGVAKGFLLERTSRILKRAGIETSFREMPPNRIFMEIQKNEQAICSFGWYKNAEREAYGRFSESIHQDRPQVVLAGARSIRAIRRHVLLKSLMSDSSLSLASADGVSYGVELDAMIAAFPGKIDSTLQAPLDVVKKIAAQRADFMFIDQEDLDYLNASNADFKGNGLVRIEYPDMPVGLKRYILCSRLVGEDVMRRINSGIAAEARR